MEVQTVAELDPHCGGNGSVAMRRGRTMKRTRSIETHDFTGVRGRFRGLMTTPNTLVPIFDGHNDTIMRVCEGSTKFFEENAEGHVDLPRAKRGGLAGGAFAVWVPNPDASPSSGETPLIQTESAQRYALSTLGRLLRLEREAGGEVTIVRTADQLRLAIEDGTFAIELHIEGAEPIDPDLDSLPVWYEAGVRSLGLVWSR